jgi:hypothetical protein
MYQLVQKLLGQTDIRTWHNHHICPFFHYKIGYKWLPLNMGQERASCGQINWSLSSWSGSITAGAVPTTAPPSWEATQMTLQQIFIVSRMHDKVVAMVNWGADVKIVSMFTDFFYLYVSYVISDLGSMLSKYCFPKILRTLLYIECNVP